MACAPWTGSPSHNWFVVFETKQVVLSTRYISYGMFKSFFLTSSTTTNLVVHGPGSMLDHGSPKQVTTCRNTNHGDFENL